MVTIDDATYVNRAVDFITHQDKAKQAVFGLGVHGPTRTARRRIPSRKTFGQSGRWQSEYHDTMIDHDKNVGTVLKALHDLGIADNTFVMYSTDNGPHMNTWPDGAMTPFRSEKNTNWGRGLPGACHVPPAGQDQVGPMISSSDIFAKNICCKAANSPICNGALRGASRLKYGLEHLVGRLAHPVEHNRETSTWVSIPCIRNCIVLTLGKSERSFLSACCQPLFSQSRSSKLGNFVSAYPRFLSLIKTLRIWQKGKSPAGNRRGFCF